MSAYVVPPEGLLRDLGFLLGESEDDVLTGTVIAWPGPGVPPGYIECDGSILLIVDFPDLFAALATTWGGDGITTFGIPDLRARTIFGQSPGGLGSDRPDAMSLATSVGEQHHVETQAEAGFPGTVIPTLQVESLSDGPGGDFGFLLAGGAGPTLTPFDLPAIGGVDASTPHSMFPPGMTLVWYIKT